MSVKGQRKGSERKWEREHKREEVVPDKLARATASLLFIDEIEMSLAISCSRWVRRKARRKKERSKRSAEM